jgi:hypothetical protein
LNNDLTATAGAALMISSPVAQSANVPFVQLVLFSAETWHFSVGDLGFVMGGLLACVKLVSMLRGSPDAGQ